MSPSISSLFEAAADDDGRPIATDFAAIKAHGRRAVVRRRLVSGATGLAVAAAVGSVAIAGGAIDLRGGLGDGSTGVASGPEAKPGGEPPAQDLTECAWAMGEGDGVYFTSDPSGIFATDGSSGFGSGTPGGKVGELVMPPATVDPTGAGAPSAGATADESPFVNETESSFSTPDANELSTPMPPPDGVGPTDTTAIACAPLSDALVGPVEKALADAGYNTDQAGGLAGATTDAGGYSETIITVKDADGNVGSAVVGWYDSADAQSPESEDPWCGPTISRADDFTWDAACDLVTGQPVITAGHDSTGQALGGLYLAADGTVIGISVSTSEYLPGDDGTTNPGLNEVPLDADQLSALLTELASLSTK